MTNTTSEVCSLRIDRIETQILDVPTIRAHVLSMTTMQHKNIVLLKMYFSDGTVGLGEASTIGGLSYGNESPEGIKLAIDTYIAPLLVGKSFISVGASMQQIESHIVGNRFAKCAVETAMLDAMGHRLGVPLSDLLGGRITDRIPVLWVLASGDLKKDIAEAEQMIDCRRHNVFKIKIGKRTVTEDVAHVAAIKRALGDKGDIRVDVNQAWTRSEAWRGVAMLTDAGVSLVEQPLRFDDYQGAQQLCAQSRIAIMADESVQGTNVAFDMASRHAADCYSIKIAQSGGLFAAQKVASIITSSGASLYGGTMLESPIGTLASAHLVSTFSSVEWGTELFAPLLLSDQFIREPLDYSDFGLQLPMTSGLGISLDEDKVAFFARK